MSNNLSLSQLDFGSLLTYSPYGNSDSERKSKSTMIALKTDGYIQNPPIMASEFISKTIKEKMITLPFAHFFETEPILIPIPNSSLMQPGTLWVPQRIANAMSRRGFGIVEDILRRRVPLPKSATSSSQNRPKAAEHYYSLEVQKKLSEPREILLIDDVVTRGATMLGAANRLRSTFPGISIKAFAAIRTISPPDTFNSTYDPCKGEITLIGQDTFRRP